MGARRLLMFVTILFSNFRFFDFLVRILNFEENFFKICNQIKNLLLLHSSFKYLKIRFAISVEYMFCSE